MFKIWNQYQLLSVQFVLSLLLPIIIIGQIKPLSQKNVGAKSGNTLPNLPTQYGSAAGNYVRAWEAKIPLTVSTNVTGSTNVTDVDMFTQYYDGLGRALQTVGRQLSPGKKDIVTANIYDSFGREQYKYLPYSYTGTITIPNSNGSFKIDPFGEQSTFFNNYKTQQPGYNNEAFFYGKTIFESSPLDRVSKTFAPGNSWAGSEGGNAEKCTSVQYLTNTSADAVKIWNITNLPLNYASADNNVTLNTPGSTTTYSAGKLYKTVTKDEKGDAVVEYEDLEGKVILKKVQIGTVATDYSGFTNWLSSYYVYDDLGQLRFVMPPKAVAKIPANGILITDIINELCFRYEYDEKQRMIAKKVPGSGWVYMVYDNRDRLVFSQDANMFGKSPKQWFYTLYDDLNRPVQTGIMGYTGTWDDLKASVKLLSEITSPSNISGNFVTGVPDMYINNREQGRTSYIASNSIVLQDGFESEDNASFTAEIITDPGSGFTNTVTVNTNPIPGSGATLYPLTYTFYDNYTWTTKTYSTANNSLLDDGGNTYAVLLPSLSNQQVKGMTTGTRIRVIADPNNLNAGKWLEAATFYDDKGRPIQINSDNNKGGDDIITNRYNFTGKVVCNLLLHNNTAGNITNLTVKSSMLYDHAGRLLKVTKKINNANARIIVQNQYDDLGQLKNKQVGQKNVAGTFSGALDNQDYTYNIRGWLKGINWDYTTGSGKTLPQATSDKWFSMDLSYDWGFSSNQYNGNISGMRWMSDGDGEERAYGFGYDNANRLLKGDFTRNINSSGTWTKDAIINFDIVMGDGITPTSAYDENGNILKMQQTGLKSTATGPQSALIDNMTYAYKNTGQVSNRLKSVTDVISADNKLGDFTDYNVGVDDYDYDVNGNLKYDMNKRISLIEYNHLNLPWRITVRDASSNTKGTITYMYDAAGNKLEKQTKENASSSNGNTEKITQTTYLSSFVYENNKLQFFGHEEGRVRPIVPTADNGNQSYAFDYFLKDHLGNVRTILTDELQVEKAIATMEDKYNATENALFYNIDNLKYPVGSISGYPADGTTNPNAYVSQLNGSIPGKRIGPARVIKVMSGDKLTVSVKALYKQQTTSGDAHQTWQTIGNQLIGALFSGGAPTAVAGKGIATDIASATFGSPSGYDAFFNTNNNSTNNPVNKPKGYLNILLFDENFVLDQTNSKIRFACNVAAGALNPIIEQDLPVKKNGYAYIYVSNEGSENVDVFFDNLRVEHNHGSLAEETHYYPFGLTMAGISSKAGGSLVNKRKFNAGSELQNQEFSDGSGLEMYDTHFRQLDPQLGRWWQIDPKPDYAQTLYSSMNNNPINFYDIFGDTIINGQPHEATDMKHATTLSEVTVVADMKPRSGLDGVNITFHNPMKLKVGEKLGPGGLYLTSKYARGNGTGTPSKNGDPQRVSIDLMMSTFGMVNRAAPLSKPDFTDFWDFDKLLGKVVKQANEQAIKLPGSNLTNTYEPNSKIDPSQTWYDGRNQGSSQDTSTHPERKYASPIYITDSAGKPISIVTGTGTNTSDTIPFIK